MKNSARILVTLSCFVCFGGLSLFSQEVTGTNATIGGRAVGGDPSSSKFTEYREVPEGLFSNLFLLNMMDEDRTKSLSLSASNLGQRDQTFEARYLSSRDFQARVRWDQIPHDFTNTARTIYGYAGNGVLQIPYEVRKHLRTLTITDINPQKPGIQFDSLALANLVDGLARPVDLVSRRDKWNGDMKFSPTDELSVRLNFSNERRSGSKPLGGLFYYQTPTELVEPTEYRTQELNSSLEYATKVWSVQLGYSLSSFKNDVDVLVWDNPFRESDILAGTSRGRMALYPDNWMHRFSFTGAANLPLSTRLVTSASYAVRRQDDAFIPFTINSAVDTLRSLPVLPALNVNGRVVNTLFNTYVISRALSPVSLSLRFRVLDYDNQTPDLLFHGYVDEDNLITTVLRQNLLVSYRKTNILAEAATKTWNHFSLRGGYEREDWVRRYGEAEVTNENIYRLIADYTLLQLLTVRSTWMYGDKEVPVYDWTRMENAIYPSGRAFGILPELPQLRKFDLAARKRNTVNILAQFYPCQIVTAVASYGLSHDRFAESPYGLTFNTTGTVSGNVSVTPSLDFSLNAYYTFENFHYGLNSRQRILGNDSPINDWYSDLRDMVHTYGCSLTWAFVPDVIDVTFDFSMMDGWGRIATRALGNATATRFLVTTAEDYPDNRSILRQASAVVRYHLTDHLTPSFAYRFEGYSESHFAQDVMEVSILSLDPTDPRAVYLGAKQPGYAVHLFYVALSYEL